MSQKVLQFCVTQCHMGQGAIAKKSSFLSQHETPPQLSNWTGRSWSCVHIIILALFEWTEVLPWWATARAHLLQAIQPWKYQYQRCNEKVPLIISKIFLKPYQCAVGFCPHHLSEAEPVKVYHQDISKIWAAELEKLPCRSQEEPPSARWTRPACNAGRRWAMPWKRMLVQVS